MAAGMTKTQLVRLMAEKAEVSNKTAAAFLANLAETAVKETKKNGVFVIPETAMLLRICWTKMMRTWTCFATSGRNSLTRLLTGASA